MERWWQVPLAKVGRAPRLHPRRHRIYRLVEDTKLVPKEKNMELILTQTVESQYPKCCRSCVWLLILSGTFNKDVNGRCACFSQSLGGEETQCVWKNLLAEINCWLKVSRFIHHQKTNRCSPRRYGYAFGLASNHLVKWQWVIWTCLRYKYAPNLFKHLSSTAFAWREARG